jgi:hypothetical protein
MIDQTRREIAALMPDILGRYHDLVIANDLDGFERLLEIYNVPGEQREELRREFTLYAARILRRRWHDSR